jgi:SAM-dependent methyltransferase
MSKPARDRIEDALWAALPAAVLSGIPSTTWALAMGRDPLEAARAAGSAAAPSRGRGSCARQEDVDRSRFSRIAHRFLPIAAPLDREVLDEVLALLPLDSRSRVLDVGCGRATVLLDLVEKRGVEGTGVDSDGEVLRLARSRAEVLGCADRLVLIEAPALEARLAAPFDLTLCIGASHALGGPFAALEHLARWARPGGHALWGEGFWRRDPDAEYLVAIGGSKSELSTHHANVRAAVERGWSVSFSAVTSDLAWDRYEGLYRLGMARHLTENAADPDAGAFRERSERWYDSYLRWGRETMGFALYLLESRAHATGP